MPITPTLCTCLMPHALQYCDFPFIQWLLRVQLECSLVISINIHSPPHDRPRSVLNVSEDAILLKHHLALVYTLVSTHTSCMPSSRMSSDTLPPAHVSRANTNILDMLSGSTWPSIPTPRAQHMLPVTRGPPTHHR